MAHDQRDNSPTLRELFPTFTDEELREAEERLDRYVDLVLRIQKHIEQDPEAYARFKALTAKPPKP